ncbi:hypothetical protein [Crassaminicella profunda]|uniref:hypothetical protein n=1 Tax=Crassaminicella profunda TaxID=1286698 RepID=UPI001CA6F004|nr:hypothetical protein [Crassaminicella profunda]QZY55848.1 hypothetical protein K7H06_02185 [Crassaminicella profunda]
MKKVMSMFVLVCLLSSMLMGCGGVKAEETFVTFNCEDGGFSVDFPEEPKDEVQTLQTPLGNIDLHMYIVEKEDIAYICMYNDYPEELIKQAKADDLLVGACNGAVANVNGKNQKVTDVTLGEYPGKDLTYDLEKDGRSVKAHQKIYLVGNRLYQMNIATDKEEENKESINKFFDSFKLNSK